MKKMLLISFSMLSFSSLISFSQNIVNNPSFEEHTGCPNWGDQVYMADGWTIRLNTPDYYHICGTGNFSVPFGAYQCPATGNAFCRIYCYLSVNQGSQEFVGRQLSSALIPAQKYYASFKVNFPNGVACASNNLGVQFSNQFYGDTTIIPAPVINNFAHIHTDSIITDTAGWTIVSGSFIADSAYQYIMVGNFFDNPSTDTMNFFGNGCNSLYLIDDICVSTDSLTCADIKNQILNFAADSIDIKEGSCINFSINTYVEYNAYQWIFEGGNPSISNDSIPVNICYDTAGNYSVMLIAYGGTGCADTIAKANYIKVNDGVGIEKMTAFSDKNLFVYPIPTENIINFSIDVKRVKLYNLLGKIFYESNNESLKTLDLSPFPEGFYFIEAETNSQIKITSKIIHHK